MSINTSRANDKPMSVTGSYPKRRSGVNYQRLPKHVIPTKYIICFKPRWEDATFEGSVIIHATIKKVTSEIVMNAVDLTIGKIKWEEDITENRQEPLEYSLDEDNELLKIKFEPPLYPSEGTLRINFNGTIYTEGYKGIHRSNRLAQDLAETPNPDYYLLTNFRPSHARRCFPCWDEPAFKASFEMCFVGPKNYTTLSNMPLKVSYAHRSNVQLHIVECLQSPMMSTHAIGFCIGKFEYLWGKIGNNLHYRVHTELHKKQYGNYAAKLLTEFIPFFNEYFEYPFPLAKLDLIVLPDVASEAVRNWGVITCRDTSIFADQDSTPMFLQDLGSLMACEVARQWFGNLVTLDWFDCLWLHEGLGIFTAHLAMEKFSPQSQIWTQFVCNICMPALDADSSRYSLAIESSVNNLADYSDLNSSVAGKKGACLIRMLYNYVGINNFRQGLIKYFKEYHHQNVTSLDFFKVMEQVSEKPVLALFSSWVKVPGYPLIRVSAKQDGRFRTFTLTQEHFIEHYPANTRNSKEIKDRRDPLWTIPITFASEDSDNLLSTVLDKRTAKFTIPIGKTHWVTINPGHYEYFRVRYSPDCFALLISAVRQKTLPIVERMSLLSDVDAMTLNGLNSTGELISILEAYVDETHYAVWKVVVSIITRLDFLLDSTDYYKMFQAFVRNIFSRIAEKTKFEVSDNEDHLVTLRRTLILSALVRFRTQPFLKEARQKFEAFQKQGTVIPHSIRVPVYLAVLQDGDEDVIRVFFKMYLEAGSLEEKGRIVQSIGTVQDSDNVKLILDFAMTEDVRSQHIVAIFQSLSSYSGREGREATWNFFKEHWTQIRHRFLGSDLMTQLVKSITGNFTSEEKATDIADFFRDHHIAGIDHVILLNCEKIRVQEAVFKRDTNLIQDYLSSYA